MAAQTYLNDAGTARRIAQVWVNDAGTARQIKEVWVNDNGTARKLYQRDVIAISDQNLATTADPGGFIAYRLNDTFSVDGVAYQDYNLGALTALENWITPTSSAGANYEVRATVNSVSGGSLSGSSTGVWLALNVSRSWGIGNDGLVPASADLTIEIRDASTLAVMDSASVSLLSSPGA